MAYVRKKGNQLAIVHGVRAPETQQVEQKTLFTFCSKAEALAAVGEQSWRFQQVIEEDHPGIRFDWKKLEAEIRSNLNHLPDIYGFNRERIDDGFREALCSFAKELMLADPQMLLSSAKVIQAHRHELEYLKALIDWRLKTCEQKENEWNKDNPFYWRAMAYRRDVPGEQQEKLATLLERGQHEEAEALARLLTECWPNYADGYNTLGLIALDKAANPEDYLPAIVQFDVAIRVGRTLFPKRLKKDDWWSDDATRPYLRGLMHKTQALNRLGDNVGALVLCERLETECFQDTTADRVAIYLNSGQWTQAVKCLHVTSTPAHAAPVQVPQTSPGQCQKHHSEPRHGTQRRSESDLAGEGRKHEDRFAP